MIRPLRDYVVLEKVPDEKKVGSIIIASTKENESALAVVIAVGPGYIDEKGREVKVESKIGDKVLYKKYSTTDYEENGRKLLLVRDCDILAVIE